ncbi:MAG TPA: alpha/beta hydrolase, partial [Verrucomicrobiae bacterium]|nr:alpha/beta hydrolase [Verrucomicrobiae bacterium]
PIQSAAAYFVDQNFDYQGETVSPGNSFLGYGADVFPDTAQPQLQTVEYDFWNANTDTLPGNSSFSPTNPAPKFLVMSAGGTINVAGYAKMAVTNSLYSGVYGYLGQYFDQAYQIDANGNVTSNSAGVISPYGQFFDAQAGPVALVTKPDIDTGERGTGIVYAVKLQLDVNHDGIMDLSAGGPDNTSEFQPYVFWANNNYDRWDYDLDDNTNYMDDVQAASCPYPPLKYTPTPDCNYLNSDGYRQIPCTRDLEDFSRLWLCGITSNLLASLPVGASVTLSMSAVPSYLNGYILNNQSEQPTIDLFAAADPDGGIGYQTNETVAMEQTNLAQCPYIGRIGPNDTLQLNSLMNSLPSTHFIWGGVSNGIGQLTLTISDGTNILGQTSTYIQIVDIKQMYERWSVGDNQNVAPTNTAYLVSDGLAAGEMPVRYVSPPNASTPYILFVHGWNCSPFDKDWFAQTALKRLYWQGYQGRFGLFRWPTDYGFTGTWEQFVGNPGEKDNYDSSEYQAWQSAQGLLNKLNDLNSRYPGQVYLLAHSMGNVVAGEALRLAGTNQVVNTYVASQAAVTAQAYDESLPNGLFTSISPRTPNIDGDWFAGNFGGGAAKIVSFYNTNDFALSIAHWGYDQQLKPDQDVLETPLFWNYGYNGSASDPSPWNNFYKECLEPPITNNFDIVDSLINRYEVMAYAAQPYETALGMTPDVDNVFQNIDLTGIWPPDTNPNFLNNPYAEHFYHSAEFRGDYPEQQSYWRELLSSEAFGVK